MKTDKKNILFIAPFVIVKEFHYPLVALAKTLHKQGYKITMVHCRQAMKTDCTAMLAKGVGKDGNSESKDDFCGECHRLASLASMLYPWKTRWIVPRNPLVREKGPLRGNDLWRMAGYEVVLSQKKSDRTSRHEIPETWNSRYKYLCEIMPQAWEILKQDKYYCVISYNSLYGIHRLFAQLGSRLSIPSLCLHQSFNMNEDNEYMLFENDVTEFLEGLQKKVRERSFKVSRASRKIIQNHTLGLFASKKPWAYSSPKKHLDEGKLLIRKRKKILVVLSSPDELVGLKLLRLLPTSEGHPFSNQILWLKWIFSLARKYPEAEFHIRPHPRLYPNKREKTTADFSLHLHRLKKTRSLPNVLWAPQKQQGSVWDHLENSDLVFNAWSTVGDIFANRAIPVFTFFPLYANSGKQLGFTSRTPLAYEKEFRKILNGYFPLKTKEQAERWLSAYLCTNTFSLAWKTPHWISFLRNFVRKKWRQRIDIPMFIFSSIISDRRTVHNLIRRILLR